MMPFTSAATGPAVLVAALLVTHTAPAAAFSSGTLPVDVPPVNERPIIGILTQPLGTERNSTGEGAYLAASYVKWVEMSGARVVPVFHFESVDNLTRTFESVNGLVFPGGGSNISTGSQLHGAGQVLYDLTLKAHAAGDPFPLWGTCMGFQFLHLLAAGTDDVLCEECFTTEGMPLALNFTDKAGASFLFNDLATLEPDLFKAAAQEKLTANSHHDGILLSTYGDNAKLSSLFDVLTTNTDPGNGRVFVSTVEAKDKMPIMATQWHPEKNNFEWNPYLNVDHSSHAIRLSQYVADRFMSVARLSTHRFPSATKEREALIYNFPAVPDPSGYFEQVYMWHEPATTGNAK